MGGLSLGTIAKIVLILLRLADKLYDSLLARKYRNEGEQKAIAELNAKMIQKNEYAKKVLESISGLDANATNDFLRELEPKS